MARKNQAGKGTVKKETMLVVALISLIAGFVGGVVYSSYKLDTGAPSKTSMGKTAPGKTAGPSREQASRIALLEKETARNPGDVKAWTELGNLYFDTGKFEKAIFAYKKSLTIDPKNADVWTDLGIMYRRIGKPSEAIKAFDKAVAVDPGHEASRFNKGVVLMHDLNDPRGALAAWEDLAKVNPFAKAPNGQPIKDLIQALKKNVTQGQGS